jgi:hypothetical protein
MQRVHKVWPNSLHSTPKGWRTLSGCPRNLYIAYCKAFILEKNSPFYSLPSPVVAFAGAVVYIAI